MINSNDNDKNNLDKINKVYTYEYLPYKVTCKVTHNGKVTQKEIDSENFSYKVIANGNTVIVILNDGIKGIAKCIPNDKYDFNKGVDISYNKALIKRYQKELKRLIK